MPSVGVVFGLKTSSTNSKLVSGNKKLLSGGAIYKNKLHVKMPDDMEQYGTNLQKLRHSLKSLNLNSKKKGRYINL